MLRFDHGISNQGVGRLTDTSWMVKPQICDLTPNRDAAVPAIYWLRLYGACHSRACTTVTRTRWVTERNALTFQCTKNVIKSGSAQLFAR
jgi:hypothetical protein